MLRSGKLYRLLACILFFVLLYLSVSFAISYFTGNTAATEQAMVTENPPAAIQLSELKGMPLEGISAGSIIRFGRYEQDNNRKNGPEEIEWIVLDYDEENNKALLLSKYGLVAKPYNVHETILTNITWENCTLRKWLNKEFLNTAFSTEEQTAILITNVDNSASQGFNDWKTIGKMNTRDQIFLLSYAEANRYLDVSSKNFFNPKSRVAPTAYAVAHGAFVNNSYKTEDGEYAGEWWLRSPGLGRLTAVYIRSNGSRDYSSVRYKERVARPAFWLNLESDIFKSENE